MATHTVPQCPGCGTHAPAPASTQVDLWTVSMIEGAGPLTLCPECSGSERRRSSEHFVLGSARAGTVLTRHPRPADTHF